jgi:sulfite reductase (NADPH) hemoprotein beta-component
VIVGGGLGRTPMIGKVFATSCPSRPAALSGAIMRVYNLLGRRDNKYKARIKILVHEPASTRSAPRSRPNSPRQKPRAERSSRSADSGAASNAYFAPPAFAEVPNAGPSNAPNGNPTRLRRWVDTNLAAHARPATPSSRLAEGPSAARRATPRPTRCAPWPIWPNVRP